MEIIEPQALKSLLDSGSAVRLLDVRQAEEVAIVSLPGALVVPMMEIEGRLEEIRTFFSTPNSAAVVICRSGVRSAAAIDFLTAQGISGLKNLRGGIVAYAREAEPTLPVY